MGGNRRERVAFAEGNSHRARPVFYRVTPAAKLRRLSRRRWLRETTTVHFAGTSRIRRQWNEGQDLGTRNPSGWAPADHCGCPLLGGRLVVAPQPAERLRQNRPAVLAVVTAVAVLEA